MYSLDDLKTLQPEVDYQGLMAQMPGLSHPRRKLKELQTKGHLIRLKKGFYVFSSEFIGRAYSPEIVGNLMYGPSYISLEYALSYYGLIPERVNVVTSITSQKNKSFQTPIGVFDYKHLAGQLYPIGVSVKAQDDGRSFLMASCEKALVDLFCVKFDKSLSPSPSDIREALEDDLRINVNELIKQLNSVSLEAMKESYRNRKWPHLLIKFLMENI
jgi:hypothetical protein